MVTQSGSDMNIRDQIPTTVITGQNNYLSSQGILCL